MPRWHPSHMHGQDVSQTRPSLLWQLASRISSSLQYAGHLTAEPPSACAQRLRAAPQGPALQRELPDRQGAGACAQCTSSAARQGAATAATAAAA